MNEDKNMNDIEYISYMRKMIGHKRMLSVGLSCLIVNEKKEVLLEKRSDNGLYCLPGGSINLNETVLEGLKREVREETGIEIQNPKLFLILSGRKEQFVYPNGDITDYVDLIFYSEMNARDIHLENEHDRESTSISFYSYSSLPKKEEFLRGSLRPIEKYFKNDLSLEID